MTFKCSEKKEKKLNQAATNEPSPTGEGKFVIPYVINDMNARSEMGERKYGTKLRINNGRDSLMDAYQEALDLVMYLKQAIMDREGNLK